MDKTFNSIPKRYFTFYCFIAPLSAIASVIFSMVLQPVLDTSLSGDWTAFARVSVWALAWSVLDQLFNYWANMSRQRITARFIKELRVQYFARFFLQRIDFFLEEDTAGHLSRLTVDAETAGDRYCGSILKIYRALWSLIISVAAVIRVRWELAIYVVVFSFLSVNLPKLFQKEADSAETTYLAASSAHVAEAHESIQGYLLIRLYNLTRTRIKRYDAAAADLETQENIRQQKYHAIDSLASGISELSFTAIIIFAMILVIQGKMSIGYVLSVSQLLGGIMFPFEVLPKYLMAFRTGREIYRNSERTFQKALETDGTQKIKLTSEHFVEIRNLSFAYTAGRPLLKQINLTLDIGKKYALVGTSGSGKSTLSKVIMGFLRPCGGTVEVGGVPIDAVEKNSLYQVLSYQSQKISFFRDTIKNNILLGSIVSSEDWVRVIRYSRLDEMLEKLPEGENTVIGEGGRNISDGEAQRIGLARCLAHSPRFMIFDEITAALDNRNAEEIEKNILALPDMGALIITHRIYAENLRRCDRIFVLKDGRLVEQGTWDALIRKQGEFCQFINLAKRLP